MRHATRLPNPLLALSLLWASGCAELPSDALPVTRVSVAQQNLDVVLGDTVRLSATVLGEGGAPLPDRVVHWSSSDQQVALVDTAGLVTAVGTGGSTITAESGGLTASTMMHVRIQFRSVVAGTFHTCGITASGHAACWGSNNAGRLGDGSAFGSTSPVSVSGLANLKTLSMGSAYSCVIDVAGAAYCWGANVSAQLGIGSYDNVPHRLAQQVATTLSLDTVASGDRHSCGLTADGQAYCWGGGYNGQLGTNDTTYCDILGERCNTAPKPAATAVRFSRLSVGTDHTCGLAADGTAYCWGANESGQLGDGTTVDRSLPTPVMGGLAFMQLSAGNFHTCGLTESGLAYCWGINDAGLLGTGGTPTESSVPVAVAGGLTFTVLSAGSGHTCGLVADGTLYCWGSNSRLQLGTRDSVSVKAPRSFLTLKFLSVSVGVNYTCGIALDSLAYCWGENNANQLGTSGPPRSTPTLVTGQ